MLNVNIVFRFVDKLHWNIISISSKTHKNPIFIHFRIPSSEYTKLMNYPMTKPNANEMNDEKRARERDRKCWSKIEMNFISDFRIEMEGRRASEGGYKCWIFKIDWKLIDPNFIICTHQMHIQKKEFGWVWYGQTKQKTKNGW